MVNTTNLTSEEIKFLEKVKPSAQKCMKDYKILSSLITAIALVDSKCDKADHIADTFNLFSMPIDNTVDVWNGMCYDPEDKDTYLTPSDYIGRHKLIRAYDNFDAAIIDFCKYLSTATRSNNGPLKYANIIDEKNIETAITNLKKDNFNNDFHHSTDTKYYTSLSETVTHCDLKLWDKEVEDELVNLENATYYVKKKSTDAEYIVSNTDLEAVKKVAEKNVGYKVFDGAGKIVYDPWKYEDGDPMYRVRLAWANQESQLLATHILKEAEETASAHEGYKVFNENGDVVSDPWKVIQGTDESSITPAVVVRPGDAVNLNKTSVYRKASDRNPYLILTGKYYFYDNVVKNGRARISRKPTENIMQKSSPASVVGFIDV